MTKFIFVCMAVLVFSFTVLPIMTDVSKERDALLASNTQTEEVADETLSFEEIYALADEGNTTSTASALNAIAPAAGDNTDEFSSGFSGVETKGLEDTPLPQEFLDEIEEEFGN